MRRCTYCEQIIVAGGHGEKRGVLLEEVSGGARETPEKAFANVFLKQRMRHPGKSIR